MANLPGPLHPSIRGWQTMRYLDLPGLCTPRVARNSVPALEMHNVQILEMLVIEFKRSVQVMQRMIHIQECVTVI